MRLLLHFNCAHPAPGAVSQVQPVTWSVDLDQIIILFITGLCCIIFVLVISAVLASAVTPLPNQAFFFELVVAQAADPLHLGGVDVRDHRTVLGAAVTDQEAALPAVVSAFGGAEVAEAAHALVSSLIGDPGAGEGGGASAPAALLQGGLALLNVAHPGLLLISRVG